MAPVRILVVDNEEDQRKLLNVILSKFGFAVEIASSAEAALTCISSSDYHMILTDLIMPDMDGTELCERIKQIKPKSRIYAISGCTELYDEKKLVQYGFDGIIRKPVGMNQLKEVIESALTDSV